ncbi:MAG: hypothetical protein Q4P25_03615 [Tissierellia bacterium]|nr:hypothetical protein [Tissierellia bacterium]
MSAKTGKINFFEMVIVLFCVWLLAVSDLIVPIKNMYGNAFYMPIANSSIGQIYYITLMFFTFPIIAWGLKKILEQTAYPWLAPFVFYFSTTVTVSIHTAFYYYYHVSRRLDDSPMIKEILKDFDRLKDVLGTMYFIGLILLSLIFFFGILRKKSIFPPWFCLLNPLMGMMFYYILALIYQPLADLLYPLLIPGTMLAIMVTVYLLYMYHIERKKLRIVGIQKR